TAVIRHYGFAVIFITPLTIFLADAASLGHAEPGAIIQARFIDTVLGCFIGLIGGILLHNARFRDVARPIIRRLTPLALLPGRSPPP
ncbi:FUSC family protein, partial [Rhodopseudomonas sp.]|uniref:FUSC family protein n=1 Tax=Rhodopseudomonas sp. TaxID=1078 RepID=UPI003B3AAC89